MAEREAYRDGTGRTAQSTPMYGVPTDGWKFGTCPEIFSSQFSPPVACPFFFLLDSIVSNCFSWRIASGGGGVDWWAMIVEGQQR